MSMFGAPLVELVPRVLAVGCERLILVRQVLHGVTRPEHVATT